VARETKIGMVVGIGFIVCFAIVLSHRGQLTGVENNPGFEIESILSEAPAQSDAEQVRRSAREIGRKQPTPTRRRIRDTRTPVHRSLTNNTVADRGIADQAMPGRADDSRQDDPGRDTVAQHPSRDNGSEEEAPRRFADAQPTRRMGDSPSGSQRFSARRNPIDAKPQAQPAATPIDLTTGDSPFETVHQRDNNDVSNDRLTSASPTAHIIPPRIESTPSRTVVPSRDRDDGVATMSTDELRERFATGSQQPARRSTAPRDRPPLVNQPQIIGEHVIESGDTLVRIARKYYQSDDPSVVTAIFEANRDKLKSPDRIVTNRRLQLPYIQGHSNSAASGSPAKTITTSNTPAARDEPNADTASDDTPARSRRQLPLHRDPKRYYEIQSGDTLGGIAMKEYGTAHPDVLKQIQQANPKSIPDLNTVVKGRRIELPAIDGLDDHAGDGATSNARLASAITVDRNSPEGDANPAEAQRDWRWYELKKGDVYTKVASKLLGSSNRWSELAEMNKDIFPDPSRIQYGVRIRVPIESEMIATTGTREG